MRERKRKRTRNGKEVAMMQPIRMVQRLMGTKKLGSVFFLGFLLYLWLSEPLLLFFSSSFFFRCSRGFLGGRCGDPLLFLSSFLRVGHLLLFLGLVGLCLVLFPFFSIFFFYLILYFFGWCINGELPTLWWDDFCSRCALIDSSNLGTAPLFKENNPSAWSSSTSFGLSPSVLGLLLFNFLHSSSMKSLFYESRLLQWEMSVNEHRWVRFVVFHFLFLAFMLVQFVWPCQFVTSQSIVLIFDQHPMTCSVSTVARNSADIFIKSTLHWSNQIWLDRDKFNDECNSFNVS